MATPSGIAAPRSASPTSTPPKSRNGGARRKAALGERATRRLTELLNAGPFTLTRAGRDVDRYGRLLRTITRQGASLGETLEGEGLAEHWQGRRGNWC